MDYFPWLPFTVFQVNEKTLQKKSATFHSVLLLRVVVGFVWIFTAPLNLKIQYVNLVLLSYLDFSFYVCVSSPLNKY